MMKPAQKCLVQIKRIVADYPDAPVGIEDFQWLTVPKYWDHIRVPLGGDRAAVIRPREEDQHAGRRFRVGWDACERVVAIWLF